jgi:predicted RNase H-like HicB family nuclease
LETRYLALIIQDEGDEPQDGYGIVFPDLPGCTSAGDTVEEARRRAAEALALHLEGMLEDGIELPVPSALDAALPEWLASVPGRIAARVLVPVELPRLRPDPRSGLRARPVTESRPDAVPRLRSHSRRPAD